MRFLSCPDTLGQGCCAAAGVEGVSGVFLAIARAVAPSCVCARNIAFTNVCIACEPLQLETPPEIPDDLPLLSVVTATAAPSFEPGMPWPVQVHRAGVLLRDDVDPHSFLAPDAPTKAQLQEKEVGACACARSTHVFFTYPLVAVVGLHVYTREEWDAPACGGGLLWVAVGLHVRGVLAVGWMRCTFVEHMIAGSPLRTTP